MNFNDFLKESDDKEAIKWHANLAAKSLAHAKKHPEGSKQWHASMASHHLAKAAVHFGVDEEAHKHHFAKSEEHFKMSGSN
jgi:hypothetical protein